MTLTLDSLCNQVAFSSKWHLQIQVMVAMGTTWPATHKCVTFTEDICKGSAKEESRVSKII